MWVLINMLIAPAFHVLNASSLCDTRRGLIVTFKWFNRRQDPSPLQNFTRRLKINFCYFYTVQKHESICLTKRIDDDSGDKASVHCQDL